MGIIADYASDPYRLRAAAKKTEFATPMEESVVGGHENGGSVQEFGRQVARSCFVC